MKKECVLYDRECINCGECDICDLDPKKICDNCGKCIDSGNDYNIMDVDLTTEDSSTPLNYSCEDDEVEDDEFFDEDFEEDNDEFFGDDADWDDEDEDDNSMEFDFGEFFGKR